MQSRGQNVENKSRGGCGMGMGSSWRFVGCSAALEATDSKATPHKRGGIAAWSYSACPR